MSDDSRKARSKTGQFAAGNSGRPKGARNKLTTDVKAMILAALEGAGGVAYLQRQAAESPAAFLTLVGKVLPMTVANPDGSALQAPQFIITPVQPAGDA